MPKNDNAHSLRLIAALRAIAGDAAAADFAARYPLSKSADVPHKFCWAKETCSALAASFGPDTAARIRRHCRCGNGRTMAQEIAACICKAGSLPAACELFTQKNRYAFLEYVGQRELIFGYHGCVCSCVKRTEETLDALWCECSAGYAEAMFAQVFGAGVQVALLESIKAGDPRCAFRVQW
ncbi:MAG: hypothetical protein IJ438_12535 [Clostridia bacterium]|nr:hypothetical protein [Clostridia bacterium]